MPSEIALIVFFTAFAVDEFSSMKDSGVTFYAADFWSWLDMAIILIGVVFLGFRKIASTLLSVSQLTHYRYIRSGEGQR